MSSELRVNKLTSRSGVGTVTFNDSGVIITGIATAATLDITGNATIAGVLSYDDVTNVDSVGIVTAAGGVDTNTIRGKINNSNLAIGARASNGAFVQALTVTPDRNIGVGEASPDVRLHVTETIDVAYSLTNMANESNHLLKLENPSTTANAFSGMQFRVGSGADLFFGAIQQSLNHGDFFFANQNSPQKEMMRIKSTGDVTIGNSSVSFPSGGGLQVYNASAPRIKLTNSTTGVASGDGLQIYVSGSSAIFDQKENAEMRFYTSATERLRITSNGVIQLSNGNLITAANSTTYISVTGGSSTADGANFFVYGGSHASNPGAFVLRSGTSEKLRITSTGQFGLGTATPVTDVDISQKTGAVALPQGTTAQRPSGSAPYIRKNTTNNALEYYDGTSWVEIITDYFPTGSTILG